MKLDVLMGTYDRFIPYFKSILSVRPAIHKGSNISLSIGVDTKLGTLKFMFKQFITRILLFNTQYEFNWGSECIGKTRDTLIRRSDAEFFLNFDDDDLLNAENLLRLAQNLDPHIDIYNFDYTADPKSKDKSRVYSRLTWTPKLWFKLSAGIAVGQSSIFKTKLYSPLPPQLRYWRCYVDDMLPNHVMYLNASRIEHIPFQIVKRCRGEESLMNTTNFEKFAEMVESLDMFRSYLSTCTKRLGEQKVGRIWKVVLTNHLIYHKKKSGQQFFNLLHREFNYEDLC